MSKLLLLMCCCLGALLLFACARPDETTNRNATAPSTTAPSPAATTATTTTANTGDSVGVAECDDFITAYDNCVSNKVPEVARTQFKTAVATWRTEWKRLAQNPQTKATLAAVCKTQLDTARTQMKAYGCTF